MPFVKVIKNKAYHKRYQVKFKRRRQCKTDYYARKRLIIQDKNKYKTPKYRFVVRCTNKDIVCQVFMADLTHDVCIASAYSHELKRYGIPVGLTNYSAAYCTGLLLARRVNAKYGLKYEGNVPGSDDEEADLGGDFNVDEDENESDAKPFCALLDVGLARTTTGARIFGALKGMCDGGVDVPHSNARFPGSVKNGKDIDPDPDKHREYIFGQHVAAHMRHRQEKDDGSYEKQFSSYISNKIGADDIEDMYSKAHAAIRANPSVARAATEKGYFHTRSGPKPTTIVKNTKTYSRRTLSQRRDRIRQKLSAQGITSLAGL